MGYVLCARRLAMPRQRFDQSPAASDAAASLRGRDGVTAAERDRPYTDDPALLDLEAAAATAGPSQLTLFAPGPVGRFTPMLGGMPPLQSDSSLELARAWFRRELEQGRRPRNTVESYLYDLAVLEKLIGAKPIDAIDRADIARFLGEANGKSTRKRRLTSAR